MKTRLAQNKFVAGVLYGVFNYGDEPQVNEIHGGAIMRQLVCSGYCYSMLIPRGPIDPSCRERAVRRTREQIPDTAKPKERARLPFFPSSYSSNNGVVMHEEADSGMPQVPIRAVQSGSFQLVRHVPPK